MIDIHCDHGRINFQSTKKSFVFKELDGMLTGFVGVKTSWAELEA
jgi:hypothetical protein